MEQARMLWLDQPQLKRVVAFSELQVTDIPISIHEKDPYEPSEAFFRAISKAAQEHRPKVIVVGNNLGAGLRVIKKIPADLHDKTVVVWNHQPTTADMRPYIALGIRHLGCRSEIRELVKKLVAAP